MSKTITQDVKIRFNADTNAAKSQIQGLYDTLTKISNVNPLSTNMTGSVSQLQEASKAAAELAIHLRNSTNVNTGKLNLKTFTNSLVKSGRTLSDFRTRLVAIGPEGTRAFQQLTQSIMVAEKPLFNMNSALKNLGTTLINSVKWQISSSVIHGLMGAAQKATGHVKALNESLNNIRIVSGQSAEAMDKFAQKANKLAKELNTTTTAYSDAALIFYQQGLNDSAVEERVNTVIKMANVTGEAAEDVSSYMTAVWNNFDDGTKSLEYYADAMAALGAATASSTKEIAAGLEKFAAIADTVGLSYEYATSALATVVAETRQSADVVGTAFKTILSRLEGLRLGENLDDGTTLNKYSAALASVGVNIKDQQGQLKDMDQILDELGNKWQNLSRDQQVALAQTVAGTRQYTQLISLMENYDTFKKNIDIASGADGTLQDQANIYAESWEAARKRVQTSAEAIYEALLDDDFFIKLNNGLSSFLDSINLLIDGMGGLKGILPVISSLLFSMFGTQIAGYIDTLSLKVQNFGIHFTNMFRSAGNKKLDIYEQQRQTASEMYAESINTSGGVSNPDGINMGQQVRIDMSNQLKNNMADLIEKGRGLVGIEKELYDQQMERYMASIKQVEQAGKETSELERQADAQAKMLKSSKDVKDAGAAKMFANQKSLNENIWMDTNTANLVTDEVNKMIDSGKVLNKKGNPLSGVNKIGTTKIDEGISQIELNEMSNNAGNAIKTALLDEFTEKAKNAGIMWGVFNDELKETSDLSNNLQQLQNINVPSAMDTANSIDGEGNIASGLSIDSQTFENMTASIEKASLMANQFEKDLGGADKVTKALGKEGKTAFDQYKKALEDATQKSEEVKKKLEAVKNAEEKLKNAKGTDALKKAQQELIEAQDELQKSFEEEKTAAKDAATAQETFRQSLEKSQADTQKLATVLKAIGFNEEQINKVITSMNEVGQKMRATSEATLEAQQRMKSFGETTNKPLTIGQGLTQVASEMSQLAMGVQAVVGIFNTLTDEDASTWQKILSVMMALPMVIMGVNTAMGITNSLITASTILKNKDNAVTLKQIATGKLKLTSDQKEKTSTLALIAVKIVKNAVEKMGLAGAIAGLAIATATIAGVIALTSAHKDETQALIEKAKAEEESANRAEESANRVREAYNQLKDSFNAYTEAKDKISELTSGTKEWNEAINETNKKARELLEVFPELSKYASMKDGILTFSDEEVQNYLKEKDSQATWSENYASLYKLTAKQTSSEANQSKTIKQIKESYSFDPNDDYAGNGFTEKAWGKYVSQDDQSGDLSLNYNAIVSDALIEFQKNQAITSKDLADTLGISEELANELVNNKTAIINNSESLTNLNRSVDILYTEIAKEILKDNPTVQGSEYKNAFYRIAGDFIEKEKEQALKNKGADHDDYNIARSAGMFGDELLDEGEDIIKQYIADRYGIDVEDIKDIKWGETEADMFDPTKDSQRVTYTINGQTYEDELITSEDMANFYAQKTAEGTIDSTIDTIDKFLKSEDAGNIFEVYGNMSASSLSGEELDQLDDFDWESLEKFGIDAEILKGMQEQVEASVQESKIARDIVKEEASPRAKALFENENFSNLEGKLGEDAFKQMVTNVDRISTQFGKEAGEDYLEALNAIPNEELRDRLAQIDITAEGSEESIRALGKEFNLSDSTINNLINTFDDFQIAAVKTGEVISQTISSILKDIDKLKMGSTISPEKYEEYKNILGDQIDSYFVKMADGTYMLTAEADSFQQILKTGTAEWSLETRNNMDSVLNKESTDLLSDDYLNELEGRKDTDDNKMGEESSTIQLMKAAGIDLENSLDMDEDGNFIINDKFIETMKQVRDIYNAADASVAGLSDSVIELDKRLSNGDISPEDYDANMRRLATSYKDARDELNEYNKAIRLYGKNSEKAKEAQLALNKAVRQAQIDEAAAQILNSSDKLKELTQGTEDYTKELENQAEAFNSAFGTSIDSSFIEKNQRLVDIWAKGGEGAEEAGNKLANLANIESANFSSLIDKSILTQQQVTSIVRQLDQLEFTIDGNADLTNIFTNLHNMGKSAEEVAAILSAIGQTSLTIEGKVIDISTPEGMEAFSKYWQNFDAKIQVTGQAPNITPDMQNVANKTKKSNSGGGGGEKKKVEDETERYHETEREIARLERETSRLGEAKDLAFGASKVELIDSETQALENEIEALEKLNSEIETYYAQDKANIAQFGATFDEYGNINNYDEIIANAVEQYNSGAWTEEKYEAFKKYLEQYEETLDKWYDNQDAITDKQRDILEKKMEKIELQVQLEIDLSEDSLEYLEYQLSKIEDEAFAAADAIALINEEVGTTLQKSATYQKGLADLEALAAENMANGIAVGSGGWTEDMISQAREYRSSLLEVNQELEEYRKTVEEKLTVAIDEMNEKLDEQIARFDTYGSILDHYTTILGLSGKSLKNSSLIIELGNKTVENAINKLESAKAKQDALESSLENAQKEYNDALARGDTETIKYWEDQIEKLTIQVEEGKETILATFEETLQTAADVFAAAVEQTVATLSSALSKYESLDTAADQFEKQKTLAEQFLDTNTQIYELSKLMRTINGEIAKTDNLAAKSKLRDVMEEINDIQANNTKLTKYDLDMLNAKYQLRLAEIALEESQNAKNQVRLTQTAGGGWGYVYTANQESIDKAQQNYEDKLYAMQQLSQDSINELSDSIIQNEQEMIEALGNLRAEDFEDYAAYEAELNRLTEYYLERDKFLREQFGKAVEDAGIDYEDTLLYKVEPAAQNWEQAHQNVVNNVNGAVQSMTDHYDEWKDKVSDAYKAAGYDEGKFRDQVIEHSNDIKKASDQVSTALQKEAKEYSDYLTNVITTIASFQSQYNTIIDGVITANENVVISTNNMIAGYANAANAAVAAARQSIQAAAAAQQAWANVSGGGGSDLGGSIPYKIDVDGPVSVTGSKKYKQYNGRTFMEYSDGYWVEIGEYAGRGSSQGGLYNAVGNAAYSEDYLRSLGIWVFDTGGYTGAWGPEGRMAMLHEKEIVLNKTDTKNLLTSIEVVRSIASQLDMIGRYQRMSELISAYGVINSERENFEQNVHISAEFPNVVDHNEIEEAINNLINYSSQYMNRYR